MRVRVTDPSGGPTVYVWQRFWEHQPCLSSWLRPRPREPGCAEKKGAGRLRLSRSSLGDVGVGLQEPTHPDVHVSDALSYVVRLTPPLSAPTWWRPHYRSSGVQERTPSPHEMSELQDNDTTTLCCRPFPSRCRMWRWAPPRGQLSEVDTGEVALHGPDGSVAGSVLSGHIDIARLEEFWG
jgi:hypothetical protein